jgi:diacylglycerol kinase
MGQLRKFNFKERLKSFSNAFSGIKILFRFEPNIWIHFFILLLVIVAGLIFRISLYKWIAIFVSAGLVLISESFNSAIEHLSDAVSRDYNEQIKRAKDVAAAGVLIAAIISVIVGLIIFLPEIYAFIS